MKRFACLLLILCLLPVLAFADTLENMVAEFNLNAESFSVSILPEEYNRIPKSTYNMIEYRISESIIAGFMESNNKITGGFVVCYDSDKYEEFIKYCACHAWIFCDDDELKDAYNKVSGRCNDVISGKESSDGFIGKMMFEVFQISTGIAFTYSIIGG